MLKRVDPSPGAEPERPVGDLIQQLVEDGKDYALAELELARAQTVARAEGYKVPAAMIGLAVLLAQAAVVVLSVAIFLALLPPIGPVLAGILTSALALGLAGLLVWLALRKMKDVA